MRSYRSFSYKDATFRIASPRYDEIVQELIHQRKTLDRYIEHHPRFVHSFEPIEPLPEAPRVACRMAAAGKLAGTGPMAAVAGTMAHLGAEAALKAGADEAIVENGGDIYLQSSHGVFVGLFAGNSPLSGRIALRLDAEDMPLAVCSSSSILGHSESLGQCDLATVVAREGALADAAATAACNMVRSVEDVNPALNAIEAIAGVLGVLIIKGEYLGKAGRLPELVKNTDSALVSKITRDRRSG